LRYIWSNGKADAVEIVDYHQEAFMKTLPNVHPGEILLVEFLNPMGISQNRLARAMDDLHVASMKSCTANAPSQLIPHSGLPVLSGLQNSCGWSLL